MQLFYHLSTVEPFISVLQVHEENILTNFLKYNNQ